MRIITVSIGLVLLAMSLGTSPQEQLGQGSSCGFSLEGESSRPTISGPDDILPLVYVVEQPDSPVEITSVDLNGTWLSVSGEQYTEKSCVAYRVHNRSNRDVRALNVQISVNGIGGGSGMGAPSPSQLPPGQSAEFKSCNGGGHGTAPDNHLRLLVSVTSVDFGHCFYRPSARIPRSLGVNPGW
jgi:hypothetical protein